MKRVFRRDDPALDNEPEVEVPDTDDVPTDLYELFQDVRFPDSEGNDDQETQNPSPPDSDPEAE